MKPKKKAEKFAAATGNARSAKNSAEDLFKEIHAEAKAKGLDKLTMREINAEIAAYRREKDPLYGQRRRISLSISERMYRELKAAADAITGGGIPPVVRQAIGDYLERLRNPRISTGSNKSEQSPRITKAISESTKDLKTGRYEP